MKTLLVLAQHPELAETVRAAINPEQYRILRRANLEEAEPLLAHGLGDACILDIESSNVQGMWFLERLRRRAPKCPVIIYTGTKDWEWEEEAYLQGASHVLTKPVRGRMLTALLDRLWPGHSSVPLLAQPSNALVVQQPAHLMESTPPPPPGTTHTLRVLRDFSGILTHSLDAEATLKQFLLLLREILGINRAAIFLRPPFTKAGDALAPLESRRLPGACAHGL